LDRGESLLGGYRRRGAGAVAVGDLWRSGPSYRGASLNLAPPNPTTGTVRVVRHAGSNAAETAELNGPQEHERPHSAPDRCAPRVSATELSASTSPTEAQPAMAFWTERREPWSASGLAPIASRGLGSAPSESKESGSVPTASRALGSVPIAWSESGSA